MQFANSFQNFHQLINQNNLNMKKSTTILLAVLIVSCTHQKKVDIKAEGEKVMELSREWARVAATEDVEKTLSYWADDAIVIQEGQPSYKGKNEIRQMIDASFKIPGFRISWEPQSVEVSTSGDMAYLIEKSQVSYNDSTGKVITQNNRAVSIWRKQADGTWKNVVDISTPEPSL